MPASTTNLVLPYPLAADPPAGHTQIKALADRLEVVTPATRHVTGNLTTSSASLVDVPGASYTVTPTSAFAFVEVIVYSSISPSASGDAKVNLLIGGVNYGQVAQVNSGGLAFTNLWSQPGSTTGNATAGAWAVTLVGGGGGSRVFKAQASSTAGSAAFNVTLFLRVHYDGLQAG